MKKNNSRIRFAAPFLALALAANAQAGTETTTAAATMTPAPERMISGVLNLDVNTHFISYGNDVWGDGNDWSEPTFNPSLELSLKLPAGFTASLGTWWDVNEEKGNNEAESAIGGRIQEVDVWAGLAYTIGDFTVKATFQEWLYASDNEEILDITLSYATFLSPSITIHNRLASGAGGSFFQPGSSLGPAGGFDPGDEGTVIVGALSYSVEAGPVTIAFPLNVAYFVTDKFHSESADEGFGYGSLGATVTYPLAFIDEAYGAWNIHGGVTYYITDDEVIPNNPTDQFFTANIGLTVAF